jgi:starvation-inducible outer membrane lipoprotein
MTRHLFWAALAVFFIGCAPAISPNSVRQASPPVNFADLLAHPEQYQDRQVVLGGEVMWVKPWDGGSLIMLNQKPLDSKLRPVEAPVSGGSFAVANDRLLSREVFVPQRKVTVAGVVKGQYQGVPLIQAQEIYPWEHPFRLIAVPKEWYDPSLEHWYTPPYWDIWRHGGHR